MRNPALPIFAVAFALLSFSPAQGQDAPQKIATVDSKRFETEFLMFVKHINTVKAKQAMIDAQGQAMAEPSKPMIERINAIKKEINDPISDEKKRQLMVEYDALAKQVMAKRQEVETFVKGKISELSKEGNAEKTKLLISVRKVIAGLAKERGISMVIEHQSGSDIAQAVWFADPSLDITDDVLAILNAGVDPASVEVPNPVTPAPTPETPAPAPGTP